jgi:hypothetical protein
MPEDTPEETRDEPQPESPELRPPSMYKGWLLPNPPSLDGNDGDLDPPGFQYPVWKRDLDNLMVAPKPIKAATTDIEWKTSPKKRKKKKRNDGDEASCQSTIVTEDGTMYIRSRSSASRSSSRSSAKEKSRSSSRSSAKENAPPTFRPSFSHSRYSKQQKFGALASYYKEKMKAASPAQEDSVDELVAIKMELCNLKEWAKKKRDKSKSRRVQFAHPLVSSLNYREKTAPEDIDTLFFREDELLDWEEDRETTPTERFEVTIADDEERVNISSECRSCSSTDI